MRRKTREYEYSSRKAREVRKGRQKEYKRKMSSAAKVLGQTRGLETLDRVRNEFRSAIGVYEQRAKSCASCTTPGACCLDEHFVNVRVSRLEAVAIRNALDELPDAKRYEIYRKVGAAIDKYELTADSDRAYACPLSDRSAGCLVHGNAKPLPCIQHACYERKEDLPPDGLLDDAELAVERLNRKVFGKSTALLPLPIAIQKVLV
jgi:hypothetical protein